eukprot:3764854-Amphidinium_carterae.1
MMRPGQTCSTTSHHQQANHDAQAPIVHQCCGQKGVQAGSVQLRGTELLVGAVRHGHGPPSEETSKRFSTKRRRRKRATSEAKIQGWNSSCEFRAGEDEAMQH